MVAVVRPPGLIADVSIGEAAAAIVIAEAVAAHHEHRHLENEQSRSADRERPENEVHDPLHLDATRAYARVSRSFARRGVRAMSGRGRGLSLRRILPGSQTNSVMSTSDPIVPITVVMPAIEADPDLGSRRVASDRRHVAVTLAGGVAHPGANRPCVQPMSSAVV